jgi:hypothetical protein
LHPIYILDYKTLSLLDKLSFTNVLNCWFNEVSSTNDQSTPTLLQNHQHSSFSLSTAKMFQSCTQKSKFLSLLQAYCKDTPFEWHLLHYRTRLLRMYRLPSRFHLCMMIKNHPSALFFIYWYEANLSRTQSEASFRYEPRCKLENGILFLVATKAYSFSTQFALFQDRYTKQMFQLKSFHNTQCKLEA